MHRPELVREQPVLLEGHRVLALLQLPPDPLHALHALPHHRLVVLQSVSFFSFRFMYRIRLAVLAIMAVSGHWALLFFQLLKMAESAVQVLVGGGLVLVSLLVQQILEVEALLGGLVVLLPELDELKLLCLGLVAPGKRFVPEPVPLLLQSNQPLVRLRLVPRSIRLLLQLFHVLHNRLHLVPVSNEQVILIALNDLLDFGGQTLKKYG